MWLCLRLPQFTGFRPQMHLQYALAKHILQSLHTMQSHSQYASKTCCAFNTLPHLAYVLIRAVPTEILDSNPTSKMKVPCLKTAGLSHTLRMIMKLALSGWMPCPCNCKKCPTPSFHACDLHKLQHCMRLHLWYAFCQRLGIHLQCCHTCCTCW